MRLYASCIGFLVFLDKFKLDKISCLEKQSHLQIKTPHTHGDKRNNDYMVDSLKWENEENKFVLLLASFLLLIEKLIFKYWF